MSKRLFLTFLLLIAATVSAAAQSPIEENIKNARDRFNDVKNRSYEIERMKRDANQRPVTNDSSKFPEIKKDFEEMQKVNARVTDQVVSKQPLDYAHLEKSAAEIKDRAARLRSNLFPAESDSETEQSNKIKSADIPVLVDQMDRAVNRFVHSSLFQNTNLVNLQDSLKAQHDLEMVIAVSSLLKEKARKLKKEISKK